MLGVRMKTRRKKEMKEQAQDQCGSFEARRSNTCNDMSSLVVDAVQICKEVIAAFEDIDTAYNYMDNEIARKGLKSVFVYASSKPHHDYDAFAFRIGTSTKCFDIGNGISDLMGGAGYDGLEIPSLFDKDFKPFCGANYYRRLFPAELREQIHSIVVTHIDNLAPFLDQNASPGGDSDYGMHIFGEMLSSGQTVRSIVADILFDMRKPNDFYAWPEILPFIHPDHFLEIIERVAFEYKGSLHIESSIAYFDSFISERKCFSHRCSYGSVFSNAIRDHITGESLRKVPTPWPCDADGLAARKAFVKWAMGHTPELMETAISALDLYEKKHRGRETPEILKLINVGAIVSLRSNQDLWLDAIFSQLSLESILNGQQITEDESIKISKIMN
jgi:hypothetical protein